MLRPLHLLYKCSHQAPPNVCMTCQCQDVLRIIVSQVMVNNVYSWYVMEGEGELRNKYYTQIELIPYQSHSQR